VTDSGRHKLGTKWNCFDTEQTGYPSTWLILNTCSSHSVTNNQKIMTNRSKCSKDAALKITNAGEKIFSEIARLKRYAIGIYFNEDSLGTILSFCDVASIPGVCIMMDTADERAISVKLGDGTVIKFTE